MAPPEYCFIPSREEAMKRRSLKVENFRKTFFKETESVTFELIDTKRLQLNLAK